MELKDLVGPHILDAVDFEPQGLPARLKDCNCIRFRLDGTVYVAIEDPNDGYRSCMGELKVMEDATMTNVFLWTRVIARCSTEDDILYLVDETTGEVVVEVGTDCSDDYYPYFVANFNPGAMVINKKA